MKLRRKKNITAEVATGSMNDIMFFLMLFFLIMSTLLNPSVIKLSLPSSSHSQAMHNKEVSVSITNDLKYYVNNTQVAFGNLEPELKKELKSDINSTIVVRCDKQLPVQNIVDVVDVVNKINQEGNTKYKVILATKSN